MIYIMRRMQLYLDDQLWKALHERARSTGTTISELVRTAARERYLDNLQERRAAMQALVGLRKNRHDFNDSKSIVRRLRRSPQLERVAKA